MCQYSYVGSKFSWPSLQYMNILKFLYRHLTIVTLVVIPIEVEINVVRYSIIFFQIPNPEFGDCHNQLRCENSYQIILLNYVYGVHRVRYATRDSSRLRHESYRTGSF